ARARVAPAPREAPGRPDLPRPRGPPRVPLRVGDGPHGWPPRCLSLPPPLRPLRAICGRAHLRTQGLLPGGRRESWRLARRSLPPPVRGRMMTMPASGAEAACLDALERARRAQTPPALGPCPATGLDGALRELVKRRGADAAPLLRTLADQGPSKELR